MPKVRASYSLTPEILKQLDRAHEQTLIPRAVIVEEALKEYFKAHKIK